MRGLWVGLVLLVVGPVSAATGAAQERQALIGECGTGVTESASATCADAVLAVEALRAGVGLSLAQGADVPGFASTVGLGLGGLPRITTSVRFSFTRLETPALVGSQQVLGESGSLGISSVQGHVGVGVFNGWAGPMTIRGILSLDLLGSLGVSILPSDEGFDGNGLSFGYGARVGIMKEGFSNPGVSLSVMRRELMDHVSYGTELDDLRLGFDPATTSVRLSAGRDFFTAGFIVGAGLDWYSGDVSVVVRDASGVGTASAASTDFTSRRTTVFAGGQYTYLVFQTSLELGWANGFGLLEGVGGSFDPGSSTYYGGLSVRLTF